MQERNVSAVTVKARPRAGDIFAYKMVHTFISLQGLIRIAISIAFLALGFATAGKENIFLSIAVLAIGLLNPVVTPLMFLIQANKAAKTTVPVSYSFSTEKIAAFDGKKRAEMRWDELALVVWMRKELLLYTTPFQALVLPRRDMEGKDGDVLAVIKAAANPDRTVYRKLL